MKHQKGLKGLLYCIVILLCSVLLWSCGGGGGSSGGDNPPNNKSWQIEVVDANGNVGGTNSIAVDSNDNVHISYYDYSNSDLKYAYNNGSSWNIQVVDNGQPDGYEIGFPSSIAVDSNNTPHISYYDNGNDCLKYAVYK